MKTILVIEDEPRIQDDIIDILELADYRVLCARNGVEGVLLAFTESPDLILCDVIMPEMDGYAVREILNESPEIEQVPFILVTAQAGRQDFKRSVELGVNYYLSKPFTPKDLLKAVNSNLVEAKTA